MEYSPSKLLQGKESRRRLRRRNIDQAKRFLGKADATPKILEHDASTVTVTISKESLHTENTTSLSSAISENLHAAIEVCFPSGNSLPCPKN